MKGNRKYLVAIALLAVIAVVFGVTGTVAPSFESTSPRQSSTDSVPPYFIIPPNFDSGWVNITSKCGQYFNITHNLNTTEVFVDITGKQTPAGGEHKKNFGGTGIISGWRKTYGAGGASSVVQTFDGGYAIAGNVGSDFLLVRTDSAGYMQWNRTYGGTGYDFATSLVEGTYYHDYTIAGYTNSYGAGGYDFYLVLDKYGAGWWNRTYGGANNDCCYSVTQSSDGGYALAGYTTSFSASADAYLVKTDPDGNMQWTRTYGGIGWDEAYSVIQTADGGYAMAGETRGSDGMMDFWLVKTDASGNMQWNKTYGGPLGLNYVAYSVVQTSDGGYAMAGSGMYQGAFGPFLLVRADSAGNMQWSKTYLSGILSNCYHCSMVQTSDGGFALAGAYGEYHGDGVLTKTDSSGNMQWTRTYGGAIPDLSEEFCSMIQTRDGGYVMAGSYSSLYSFWLVKTDIESGLAWTDSSNKTVTLHRGETDTYWNFVRIRVWTVEEPTWQYGDINQDGIVDALDLYILSRNYGKTFSVASLGGIAAIAGVHTYKKRKEKQDS